MTRVSETSRAALVLTVGTGNRDDPKNTLFEPLLKSFRSSHYDRIVLLPSSSTADLANEFLEHPEIPANVCATTHPLPKGAEYDADEAYAHFDSVLGELLHEFARERVHIDFTRGTKAMSAAAVLVAARRAIPNLRYVHGARDRRGSVQPGTERVLQISTATVDAHRRRDLARDLMQRGNFSAVPKLLPDADSESTAIRDAAAFYAAWDRLNYEEAADCRVPEAPPGWGTLWPTAEMHSWVEELAKETDENEHPAMARRLRLLIVDLLASGERRVEEGQFEDAYVRAYRVLELVGQARLFALGLDSSRLDPEHEAVKRLQKRIEKRKQRPLEKNGDGAHVTVGRLNAARLLKRLGDPLARRLLSYDKEGQTVLDPKVRNHSLLIHGFSAKAPADPAKLKEILNDLEDLARFDAKNSEAHVNLFEDRLRISRSMPFRVS